MPSSSTTSEDSLSRSTLDILPGSIGPEIHGSSRHALNVSVITMFTAYLSIVAIGPVVNTTNLSNYLKNILVAAPSLTGAILQLPTAISMDKNGGKKAILILRAISVLGATGLTSLSLITDLSTMEEADWRFALMLIFALTSGVGLATFPLIANVLYWSKLSAAGDAQAKYAGISGLAPGLSLLFLQFTLEIIGIPATFALFTLILAGGGLVAAKYLIAPPYHQLLAAGYSQAQAKLLAGNYGQEKFPTPPANGYYRAALTLFGDIRIITLAIDVLSSFGGFLSSTVSMFLMLTDVFKLSARDAVIITAAGSLLSTISRILSGKFIDKYDKSGGAYSFITSSAITIVGASLMLSMRTEKNLPTTFFAKFLMDIGFGTGAAATFKLIPVLSAPERDGVEPYNIGSAGGDVSTAGAASGFIFPTIVALLLLIRDEDAYFDNYIITAGMSILGVLLTSYTHFKMNNRFCFFQSATASDDTITLSSPSSASSY